MSDMNMYNILGKFNNVDPKMSPVKEETKTETVYEHVKARGDIMEAVRSMESKFATFKESAKPDFLDLDKDGNKKEPMKKAVKDKNNAKGAMKDMFGGSAKDLTSKLKIKEGPDSEVFYGAITHPDGEGEELQYKFRIKNGKPVVISCEDDRYWDECQADVEKYHHQMAEGAGPYTLDDPKHPKFKANYEKFKKSNPDCKLADFVAAMRKKEKALSEAAYDEPEAPNADAIAKRKRLQAIKDRQEDERAMGGSSNTNTPIRKVAGKAYGGAAQADDPNEFEKGNFIQRKKSINLGPNDDLDEVAPPGKKAERMVKHIKKGYATDGNLSKKEKGIAYATAWKAKKSGHVEEGVKFGDTVKNSKAEMKKAKPAMVKESRVMEETDYFYEKVGKALAEKQPTLDTAGSEFVMAVRKEMVAQGIPPNKARNILFMDEDFLSDVATSYGHYCKEVAESSNFFHNPNVPDHKQLPAPPEEVNVELDEIAKLAGLPVRETEVYDEVNHEEPADENLAEAQGVDINGKEINVGSIEVEGVYSWDSPDFADAYITYAEFMDGTPLSDDELVQLEQQHGDLVNQAAHDSLQGSGDFLEEEEMEEGNEFSGALAAAKASGSKEFEVDGKKYTVKEDINVNITANGQEDALNLFRKLAGMDEVTPTVQAVELPQDAASAIAQGVVEPVEVEVAEERDIEYTNTPNEKIGPVSAAIPSGTDMHRAKKSYSDKPYRGDNPMAVREDALWKSYENMIKDVKA